MIDTIQVHHLIRPGQRVLVGVSGGPDSWALLLALQKLSSRLGIAVHAACVDHGLRPESADEARAVARVCTERDLPCDVLTVNVHAHRAPHVSWQDAARRARLQALEAHAAAVDAACVALGHNADDQAETVLFRIVRGTGLRGLAGIPYRRGVFIRPLLDVRRRDIERFVARAGVQPVRDPSNADARFTRARVRHAWLPLLVQENPKVVEALTALAAEARLLPPKDLQAEGPTLSRRAAAAVARLSTTRTNGSVSVPGGRVEIMGGRTAFVAGALPTPAAHIDPVAVEDLPQPRRVAFPGGAVELALREGACESAETGVVCFDADALVWPLTIRTWRAGDVMRPRRGRGSRKLQDLFVDAKVPREQRRSLPVLTDATGVILFVPGLRPSGYAVPGTSTRRCLLVGGEAKWEAPLDFSRPYVELGPR